MKQISLAITGCELVTKRTRKRVFLDQMNLVVPWTELIGLIQPHAPTSAGAKGGRPAFAVETMLRIHFFQQWFGLSDPAMEESLHDTPLYCEFARLDPGTTRLPDESTILRFRHLLEANILSLQIMAAINATLTKRGLMLRTGTVVDATLIAAPSSTKNSSGERDPEMHQTKKGNQWHFGMKAHIGVDADSGLVHTVIGTAANVNDVTQSHGLLHGLETVVFADAGYQGAAKRVEATGVDWHVAMRPDKRRALGKNSPWGNLLDQAEQLKASARAKVEHSFRVLKCQFGFTKIRYKGLAKNTAQLITLFALSNLRMVKSLSKQQRGWLKRRTAVEPAIGHLKSDHRMDRCWLKGSLGDALHTIGCAAGYNLRWLIRVIAWLGIGAVFCVCCRQRWSSNAPQQAHTVRLGARGWRARAIGPETR